MSEQLKSFFNIPISSPNEITSEQLKLRDTKAKQEQDKWPAWKRKTTSTLEKAMDATMSFMGIPLNESRATQYGELGQSGLPFAAFGPKGIKSLYHGTRKIFDKFDPSRNDPSDVLGHMTHFAENPSYASSYAEGNAKYGYGNNSNIIIAKPDAKNVLDLVDPNADDISQAVALSENKNELIRVFKQMRKETRKSDSGYLPTFRHYGHVSSPEKEWPIRAVAENLKLSPSTTENMPWDAIRYHDVNEKSWAFPARTPIKSFFGDQSLTEEIPISPIKGFRKDDFSAGNFPAAPRLYSKDPPPNKYTSFESVPQNKYLDPDMGLIDDVFDATGHDYSTKPLFGFEKGNKEAGKYIVFDENGKPKKSFHNLDDVIDYVEGTSLDYLHEDDFINNSYTENFYNKTVEKPKTHTIPKVWDQNTNQELLQVGTKKFPQTPIGLALAKQEIKIMFNNDVITSSEAQNMYKSLKKYKAK